MSECEVPMPVQPLFVGNPALIVVDIQRGAALPQEMTGIAHMSGWEQRMDKAERLVAAARGATVPVNFFQEVHRRSGLDFARQIDAAAPGPCPQGGHRPPLCPPPPT